MIGEGVFTRRGQKKVFGGQGWQKNVQGSRAGRPYFVVQKGGRQRLDTLKMKKIFENKESTPIQFTDHQLLIIQLWSEKARISQVAEELDLSEHTIQTHLKRMRRKLGVRRTFDVYRYVKERELI